MVLKKMLQKKIKMKKNKKRLIHRIRMKKIKNDNMNILPPMLNTYKKEITGIEFMNSMIDFLADDYQLITLTKTKFMKSELKDDNIQIREYKKYLENQFINHHVFSLDVFKLSKYKPC